MSANQSVRSCEQLYAMTKEHRQLPRLVAIHGAPRSGTSWLGQLFNSSEHVAYRYQPLFSYAFRDWVTETSTRDQIEGFIRALLETDDDFVLQRNAASLAGYTLEFRKLAITHLVYKEVRHHEILENLLVRVPQAVGIGIVRHPCAVIHSWARAPREFDPSWSLKAEWRAAELKNAQHAGNWYGFVRWKRLAELFCRLEKEWPGRFLIVRYESLAARPFTEVRKLFAGCRLEFSDQVATFVERSQSMDDGSPYGVMRDRSAGFESWRRGLDSEIAHEITADLLGTPLERFLGHAS